VERQRGRGLPCPLFLAPVPGVLSCVHGRFTRLGNDGNTLQIFWLLECLRFVQGSGPSPLPIVSGGESAPRYPIKYPTTPLPSSHPMMAAPQSQDVRESAEHRRIPPALQPQVQGGSRHGSQQGLPSATRASAAAFPTPPVSPSLPFPTTRTASDENMRLAVDLNLEATARNLAEWADKRQAEVTDQVTGQATGQQVTGQQVTDQARAPQLVAEHSWRVQEEVWQDYADVLDQHAAPRQRAGVRAAPDSHMPLQQRAGILVDRHGGGKAGALLHPSGAPSAKLHEAMWAALEEDRGSSCSSSSDSLSHSFGGAPLSDLRPATDQISTGSESLLSQVWLRFCATLLC